MSDKGNQDRNAPVLDYRNIGKPKRAPIEMLIVAVGCGAVGICAVLLDVKLRADADVPKIIRFIEFASVVSSSWFLIRALWRWTYTTTETLLLALIVLIMIVNFYFVVKGRVLR